MSKTKVTLKLNRDCDYDGSVKTPMGFNFTGTDDGLTVQRTLIAEDAIDAAQDTLRVLQDDNGFVSSTVSLYAEPERDEDIVEIDRDALYMLTNIATYAKQGLVLNDPDKQKAIEKAWEALSQ